MSFVLAGFSTFLALILGVSALVLHNGTSSVAYGVSAAIFLVGALMLLCMGVLGEYIGRVYDEVRSRPLSIINKVYYTAQMNSIPVGIGRQESERERVYRIA
jgi:dolichol-phosphate mannosyltransferase